jgi:nitroreductase
MTPVIALLNSHRSIRRYSATPIDDALLQAIVRAGQAAATSSFLQGCTVIRVRDAERRRQLAALAGNQAHVQSAAEFLVLCADLKRAANACAQHDKAFAGDCTEHFIIATVDVALMAQNMVVAAESAGLGICYIGGLRNQPREVCELLQLPVGVYPVFGLCLGYPAQNPECKPRLPLDVVLKDELYSEEGDAERIALYDAQVREYYRCRTGGGHGQSWSEQVADLLSQKARPHMREFLASQGFTLR